MEIIKKEAIVKKYSSENELSAMEKELLQAAHDATQTAYAPYSKFKVGCALLLENGVVIKGSNQENIAYPSGLCAERVAIFHAGATYPNVPIKMMAVTAKAIDYKVSEPVMPFAHMYYTTRRNGRYICSRGNQNFLAFSILY
jgi:cytidine deaminase